MNKSIDKPFLISVIILSVFGFFIFTSASLGLLAKNEAKFTAIATNQFLFGICLGGLAAFLTSRIPYKFWKKWSLWLFIAAVILTMVVFIPGVGMRHGGALRWISLGGLTFQPSEVLKLGYIFYLAAVFSKNKKKLDQPMYGLIPFCIISGIVALIIGLQPDNDTVAMTLLAGAVMFFVAGAKKRDLLILGICAIIGFLIIFSTRPYVRARVMTFFNPSSNSLSSGYQIQQSMIAIGSGGLLGKGFGQSTQKFSFLPEPIGDSIFAVASEEFGFVGSVLIVLLFLFFAFRGLKIAIRTQDEFARLTTLGIVILVITGSFINISAMLGIIPLSGTPLVFVSHGGTSLFITLAMMGIIFNISRNKQTQIRD
jgi:cell division protein FtsW